MRYWLGRLGLGMLVILLVLVGTRAEASAFISAQTDIGAWSAPQAQTAVFISKRRAKAKIRRFTRRECHRYDVYDNGNQVQYCQKGSIHLTNCKLWRDNPQWFYLCEAQFSVLNIFTPHRVRICHASPIVDVPQYRLRATLFICESYQI
jgi:hypothetical protein